MCNSTSLCELMFFHSVASLSFNNIENAVKHLWCSLIIFLLSYSLIENSFYPIYLNVPFFKGTPIDIKLFCYKQNHSVELLISLQLPWRYYFQEKQLNFHVMVICAVHVNTKKLLHYYLTINYHFWERLNYI